MKIQKRLIQHNDNTKIQTIDLSLSELKIIQNTLINLDSDSYNIEQLRKKLEYYITNFEN